MIRITRFGIIISIVTVLVLTGIIALVIYLTRPQGTLELALAPTSVTLTIDGAQKQSVKHGQKLQLAPGTYHLGFTRQDFADGSTTVTIRKGQTSRIAMALTPKTDAARAVLAGESTTAAVTTEYKQQHFATLLETLPLSGQGYTINSCPSVRYPNANKQALCANITASGAKDAMLTDLQQMGYDPTDLELLTGANNVMTLAKTTTYEIDYYLNAKPEGISKLPLFITPLISTNATYATAHDPALEAVREAALADLTHQGYNVNDYAIFYSNTYLARYNPNAGTNEEHAAPPIP